MIILNTTTKVLHAISENWRQWMIARYIPEIKQTGLVEKAQFVVLLDDDDEGVTFALQLFFPSAEMLEKYQMEHLQGFQKMAHDAWGANYISFSSLMEVIN